ncbi:MAG TPA: protein kinase [Pyrinomonadaceae bacterium]|nr:protein kinase [Pyrinomonadaceae bacterium]
MNKELATNSTLSHYRIVSRIGAGGMGEVYLAEDSRLHRKVALKILPVEMAANHDRMRRFKQEATAAAALNHPNIAHIYEIGESGGTNFIAMEFVEGMTLREKIHSEKTELRKLLRYLQHTAEGLAKAHAAGIVHRDLKPDNIMITRDGHAKILDFGLAKLVEPQLTNAGAGENLGDAATAIMQQHSTPGMIMGTVGYMSPEQAQGKTSEIDQRSDIFSFGCILFEAATKHKPFEGDSIVESLHSLIHEPTPQIKDLNPSAPSDLQRIIRRCLAKDPEERYQTIKDVAIELKELRRELETGSTDPDSTVPSPISSAMPLSTNSGSMNSLTSAGSGLPTVSSAEYVVQRLKRHKLGFAIALAILIGAVTLFAYLLDARNNDRAIDSIAVLPFQNKSSGADTEYLSDGLAESLIYRLSQLPNLKVSPTSSVMRYKGKETDVKTIASELGVSAVMTGRIAQRGDSLTISVELVDVRNNKLLWGEQYDRKMSDLLATQREIASTIAEKLQVRLSGGDDKGITKRYTNDNEAYQLYLKGRFYWNKRTGEGIRKAIELLTAATEKDPNFALAYAALADSYVISSNYTGARPAETMPQAKAYAKKSIELDGTLAEPHAALAMVTWNFEWDKNGAEREYKKAIELNPNYPTAHHWYSRFLRAVGRQDEAFSEIKRAAELDPLSLIFLNNIAEIYLDRGDLNASFNTCRRMNELDPGFWSAHSVLGIILVKQGRFTEAKAEALKAVELSNRSSGSLALLGYVIARSGRRDEAQSVITELEKKFAEKKADARDLAIVYAGLNDKDKAFEWLEKAYQYRSFQLGNLRLEPLLIEALSGDPRWADLFRRIGLS